MSSTKRARSPTQSEASDSDDDIGPVPMPVGGDDGDVQAGPSSPSSPSSSKKAKVTPTRQRLPHESLYLSALPSASRYHQSFMHRSAVNYACVTPYTSFVITTSVDGHLKFWKKQEVGIEFVKHYRAHLGVITAVSCSADGGIFASAGSDKSIKVFDVVNFDLINMIQVDYTPRAICWIHKKGRAETILAVTAEGSNVIRLYDGRGDGKAFAAIESIHRRPPHVLAYNEAMDCVVSADEGGMVEVWSPEEPYDKPSSHSTGLWEFKAQTDLFEFKKRKSTPTSMSFSPDYSRLVTHSLPDRVVRVFNFRSGKITHSYDESLATMQEMQTAGTTGVRMDDMEFARRCALEKQLDTEAADSPGAVNASQGLRTMNAVFDETGHFLVYPTMLGIKIVNTFSDEVAQIIGQDEPVRFLNVSLFQGIGGLDATKRRQKTRSLALMASENPAAQTANEQVQDPTLFCTAHKRERFYLFTRLEPEDERDVFNEKPSREDQTIAAGGGSHSSKKSSSKSATSAILHTTLGDIHLRLFGNQTPKTVENFVGLAKKHYYDGVIFHRVIRKFMLQTGDPLGDGTGGESIWGRNFDDEFVDSLKHDRPYTLSMANAGPGTNGSQFFITTVPTPWLDRKHTVFGRATAGLDVIHRIENVKVDENDKPREAVQILNISLS